MRISMLGSKIDALTLSQLQDIISESVKSGAHRIIANHNLHSIYLFHHDPEMRKFYGKASTIHIDGMSLVYLSWIFGYPVRREHRVTYVDLTGPLLAESARQNWRVFYLGGKPGVAEEAAKRLCQTFPGLELKTHHGFFETDGQENMEIVEMIRGFRPDVLMVGMGMPRQEQWILKNFSQLDSNVVLAAGACFDYVAGVISTPPRWMGRVGLEWLSRLITEPRRLWKRYLLEPWYVLGLVFMQLLEQKILRKRG